jgi:hypothetical protein
MGFKAVDLAPLGANGPTAVTPTFKDVICKAFSVARTDTVASIKAVIPGDATIINVMIYGTASNAGTTATLSVGTTSTATEIVNAQDVKTAGGLIRPTSNVGGLFAVENIPISTDIQLYAKYAETGAASSAGAWTVLIEYVR